MDELALLQKIVNIASADHDWKLKMDARVEEIPADQKYKRLPTQTFRLNIRSGKMTAVTVQRTLSDSELKSVTRVFADKIFNELARQAIILLSCKGIDKIV